MIKDHKFLILLVLFNQIVSPDNLSTSPQLSNGYFGNVEYKLAFDEAADKLVYCIHELFLVKIDNLILSKVNCSKLKSLSNILYSGMSRSGYFAALKASAERLKAQGVDGKRVTRIELIYHSGEQLPGYLVILEDDSEEVVTMIECTLGIFSTSETNTLQPKFTKTMLVYNIENVQIGKNKLRIEEPLLSKIISNKNSLSEEEIKRYNSNLVKRVESFLEVTCNSYDK